MLSLYYYNKVEIASVFHIRVRRMWKTHRSHHHHPRRGRACPARALSAAARNCFTHPVSPHTVGRGLDPSACPFPAGTRSPFRHPVGAGHARPATSRRLPSLPSHSPKPPDPATLLPLIPHNLCPRTAITPIYTLPKLLPQTLSKKSKKLAKTC